MDIIISSKVGGVRGLEEPKKEKNENRSRSKKMFKRLETLYEMYE